jgi:hypothetical protein
LNNAKLQKMNWKALQQIVNVTRLRLYQNLERSKEKLFLEDRFDIEKEKDQMEFEQIENFEVDRIMDMKKEQRKKWYFMRWRRYSGDMNSWELERIWNVIN